MSAILMQLETDALQSPLLEVVELQEVQLK